MTRNFRDFCCDPFKSHRCHIVYTSNFELYQLQHPSLSGDIACCNCLHVCKLNPEIAFVDTSNGSGLTQTVVDPNSPSSQHGADPSRAQFYSLGRILGSAPFLQGPLCKATTARGIYEHYFRIELRRIFRRQLQHAISPLQR